jgi:hypothetical protein
MCSVTSNVKLSPTPTLSSLTHLLRRSLTRATRDPTLLLRKTLTVSFAKHGPICRIAPHRYAIGTAQSFLVSPKIETCSNPAHWNFNAVNAELRACPCCYRCSRGTEAKLGGLEGKPTSGSYSPTRTHGFDYDPKLFDGLKPHARPEINQAGQASLEILPAEILGTT